GVAEDWLTGEHWNHFGNDAEEWQCNHVHLRVAEEPEQVLPQNRTAVSGVEDVAAKLTVIKNTKCSCEQQWEDQQRQDGSSENRSYEHWQTEHGHARCQHRRSGGEDVDGRKYGTNTRCTNTDDPHVCAYARSVDADRQRHVHGPTEVSCATWGQEAG